MYLFGGRESEKDPLATFAFIFGLHNWEKWEAEMLILSGQRSQSSHPTSYNAQGSQAPTTNHYLTLTVCRRRLEGLSLSSNLAPFRALAIDIPQEHF